MFLATLGTPGKTTLLHYQLIYLLTYGYLWWFSGTGSLSAPLHQTLVFLLFLCTIGCTIYEIHLKCIYQQQERTRGIPAHE